MKRLAYMLLIPLVAGGLYCKKETTVQREGIVNFLSGTVAIIDGQNRSAARVGDAVRQGMTITTGPRSFVDIYFDENAVKILENSEVEIAELELIMKDDAEKTRLYLKQGKMFSRVAKKLAKDDSYQVATPTSTAGVRGTEFLVASDELKSLIATLNGTVEVKNDTDPEQKAVEVPEGKQVEVEKDRKMTVEELSAENKKLLRDIKKDFREMKREIRQRFEKKRHEIRKAVRDQREKNRDAVDRQKELDRENVERQKATDKENIERIKETADTTAAESQDNVTRQAEESKEKLESVKPEIKKFKSNIE
ncbi:MAG: FecR domain-containing protein [Spirochaetes bacterium]|nr:FecR domain-containing protein [Spirochaetota bacterium]